ncbi:hypothetical protein ACIRD4_35415 [Streptomyces clavifer]
MSERDPVFEPVTQPFSERPPVHIFIVATLSGFAIHIRSGKIL